MNNFVILVIIAIIAYIFYKKSQFTKGAVEAQKPVNQIKEYERLAEYFKGLILDDKTFRLVAIPGWEKSFIKTMEDWYTELSEKNKHDLQKSLEHAKDWHDFVYYEWESSNARELLDVSTTSEESEARWDEIDKLSIKIKEISKRFASQAGADIEAIYKELSEQSEIERAEKLKNLLNKK